MLRVNLSRTASVEISLQPQGASANVTVHDTSGAAVDVSNNTSGTSVSTEQFSNLPTQRTVQSLPHHCSTVARSGLRDASGRDRDPSVGGSSGPENNYILDGVNTTDPAFGGSGANLPFEFVQEVEIKTGAYGAEYGRATGGIFNVITKSGGNEFHGDGFGYFTAKSFVRDTKQFPFTGSAPNGFSEIDAGVDVGGPIKKDKIWFFAAFNPQQRRTISSRKPSTKIQRTRSRPRFTRVRSRGQSIQSTHSRSQHLVTLPSSKDSCLAVPDLVLTLRLSRVKSKQVVITTPLV